jgi:hypothetical protein
MGIQDLFNAPVGSSVKGRTLIVAPPKEETIFSKSYIERKAREAEEAKQKELDEKEKKRNERIAKKANASQIVAGLPTGAQTLVNVGGKRAPKEKAEPKRSEITCKTYFAGSDVPRVDHFEKLSEARKYASAAVSHLRFKEVTDVDPETGEVTVKLVHVGFKTPDASVVDLTWRRSEPSFDDQGRFLAKFVGDFADSASYTASEFRRQYQDKCNKEERALDAAQHNLIAVDNDPKKVMVPFEGKPSKETEVLDLDGVPVKIEMGEIDPGQRAQLEDNLRASVVRNLNKSRGTEITRNVTRPSVAQWQQRARGDRSTFSKG